MTEIETRSVKETKKNRQTNCWEGKTEKSDYVMTGKKDSLDRERETICRIDNSNML